MPWGSRRLDTGRHGHSSTTSRPVDVEETKAPSHHVTERGRTSSGQPLATGEPISTSGYRCRLLALRRRRHTLAFVVVPGPTPTETVRRCLAVSSGEPHHMTSHSIARNAPSRCTPPPHWVVEPSPTTRMGSLRQQPQMLQRSVRQLPAPPRGGIDHSLISDSHTLDPRP
jgi:hypothetical protein